MPSARSTMSLSDMLWQRLVAGDLLDQGHHFAGSEPVDRQRRHMRPPDPRRGELRPEGHEQQNPERVDLVHQPAEHFQARRIGPMRVLEDHQDRRVARDHLGLADQRFHRLLPALRWRKFKGGITAVVRQRQHLGQ